MKSKILDSGEAVLIELDNTTREEQFGKVAAWLNNVTLTQSSFTKLLENTSEKVVEPHFKDYLKNLLNKAKDHEEKIGKLYEIIGHEPTFRTKVADVAGKGMAKMRELLADGIALSGAATGPWQDIQQLYLSNANSMGTFAVVEQLGLALGIPDLTEIAFHIVKEKSTDQLVIQEYLLEYCSYSILYDEKS